MDIQTSDNWSPLARGTSGGAESPRDALADRRAARHGPNTPKRKTEEAR